jgi:integrase
MKAKGQGLVYRRGAVWWLQYYVRGERYRESSESTNRAEAVRLLKTRHGEAASGKPIGPDVAKTTLEHLTEIITNEYQANGRQGRVIKAPLAHLTRYFGKDCRAIEITSDRLTAFITHRQEQGAANATINRSLAALKRAFTLAEQAGKVARSPHFPMLREDNRRKGFFEHEAYASLAEHLPDYLRPAIQTAYLTGWRITSEILTRQKHHLDLDAGWLRLEPGETKNGEGRRFPLTPDLREVLERQLERTRALEVGTEQIIPWLFHHDGKPIRVFRRAWVTACSQAGLPGKIPHDFRRTAVRNLERAGVPRSAAMAMVGHKTEAIYRRYAIADESMLRDGADKLAALHQADTAKKLSPKVVPLAKGN